MKKEVKDTLEENIDTAIATGVLGFAGNINELLGGLTTIFSLKILSFNIVVRFPK